MNLEKIKKRYPNVSICPGGHLKGCFRTNEVNDNVENFEIYIQNGIPFFCFFKKYSSEKIYTKPEQFLIGRFDEENNFILFPTWLGILRQFNISETMISIFRDKFEMDMDAPTRVSLNDISEIFDDAGINFELKYFD